LVIWLQISRLLVHRLLGRMLTAVKRDSLLRLVLHSVNTHCIALTLYNELRHRTVHV